MENFRISGTIFHGHDFPDVHALGVGQWRLDGNDGADPDDPEAWSEVDVFALNEKYEPICPDGKPIEQWEDNLEENSRLRCQMRAYVGKRFDERMRLTFGNDLRCFVVAADNLPDRMFAIVGSKAVLVNEEQFNRLSAMYSYQGEIPIVE